MVAVLDHWLVIMLPYSLRNNTANMGPVIENNCLNRNYKANALSSAL